MKKSKLAETFPELKGLENDVQEKIVSIARNDILDKKRGSPYGPRKQYTLLFLSGLILHAVLYFIFHLKGAYFITSLTLILACIFTMNHNFHKALREEVSDLARKEKLLRD